MSSGSIHLGRVLDFQAMQQTLAALWRPRKGVFIKELDSNRFIFQFYHELDVKIVVEGSPWYFNIKVLIFARMTNNGNHRCIPLQTLDMWVQVHDLQPGFMTSRVLKAVDIYSGKFLESCSKNFMGVNRIFGPRHVAYLT